MGATRFKVGAAGGRTSTGRWAREVHVNYKGYFVRALVNEEAKAGIAVKLDTSNEGYVEACDPGEGSSMYAVLLQNVKEFAELERQDPYNLNTVRKGMAALMVYAPAELETTTYVTDAGDFSVGDPVYVGTSGYLSPTASGTAIGKALADCDVSESEYLAYKLI